MEADRQEQAEGQEHPAHGRGARPQADERRRTHGQLAQGDHDAERHRHVLEVRHQGVDRAHRAAEASCDWIDVGFEASKNPGLASFCRPAKTNVTPRKTRNGSKAQPAIAVAPAGGPQRARARGSALPRLARGGGRRLSVGVGRWQGPSSSRGAAPPGRRPAGNRQAYGSRWRGSGLGGLRPP